jgi:hypothetical protein
MQKLDNLELEAAWHVFSSTTEVFVETLTILKLDIVCVHVLTCSSGTKVKRIEKVSHSQPLMKDSSIVKD